MTESIFVALSSFAEYDNSVIEMLAASGFPYKIHSSGKRITREELLLNAVGQTVIIAGIETYDDSLFDELPQLKCIVRLGVGVDSIDLVSAKKRNITVLNTPDIPTTAVAELAISLYFSLSRNLRPQANSMGQKKWERLESHLVSGKTIGIIGFGRIGKRIAEFCQPFGITVLVCDPFVKPESIKNQNITLVDKDTLLHKSDIISIHASKTDGSGLIIAGEDYSKMKKGAILVNLSRGGMIDEEGLVAALTSKHLAGAGLDVFGNEPYNGPLCDFENVILTPHSATLPVETRVAMEKECVDKALRFIKGTIAENERVV
jgi:D-3-phosphoglycerate dehydrogenase